MYEVLARVSELSIIIVTQLLHFLAIHWHCATLVLNEGPTMQCMFLIPTSGRYHVYSSRVQAKKNNNFHVIF